MEVAIKKLKLDNENKNIEEQNAITKKFIKEASKLINIAPLF